MAATNWAIFGILITALGVGITFYYLARQSARENSRQQLQAIADAKEPLQDEISQLRQDKRDKQRRIDRLEDELRRERRGS